MRDSRRYHIACLEPSGHRTRCQLVSSTEGVGGMAKLLELDAGLDTDLNTNDVYERTDGEHACVTGPQP